MIDLTIPFITLISKFLLKSYLNSLPLLLNPHAFSNSLEFSFFSSLSTRSNHQNHQKLSICEIQQTHFWNHLILPLKPPILMNTSISLKFLSSLISITHFQMSLLIYILLQYLLLVFSRIPFSVLLKYMCIWKILFCEYPQMFLSPYKKGSDSSLSVFLMIFILWKGLDIRSLIF